MNSTGVAGDVLYPFTGAVSVDSAGGITVTAAGRRFVREVRSGSSFMSQGDLRLHVGLGAHAAPVDVEVRMPGGDRWAWRGLAVDRLHALELSPGTRIAPATGVSR